MKYFIQVLIDGKWRKGPAFPLPISSVQTLTCDEILYGNIYSIFTIVTMDIQLFAHLILIRYIGYQMMNGNGKKSERFE